MSRAAPIASRPAARSDNDYSITYVAGSLTVTTVSLSIAANNQSKVYGAAVPTLTATYAGFVNGDTSSSLTTQPTLTTTANASSPIGTVPHHGQRSSGYRLLDRLCRGDAYHRECGADDHGE